MSAVTEKKFSLRGKIVEGKKISLYMILKFSYKRPSYWLTSKIKNKENTKFYRKFKIHVG